MKTPDIIAAQLGIAPATRERAARELYLATEQNPLTYWTQLFIAAGIAHLGLVLNSTAVVIGAMLVSPLMTPIVQVGMGFAVGNSFLAAKASIRILASILITVAFAAFMTKVMPYEAVTAEILARTRPTALDLGVALFCGLAAAFTTARGSGDTITAAAGTAIAIALVPPLCVIGFGVGIGSPDIVWGSTLLFIANLSAIILISDVFFLVTGFAQLDVQKLEDDVLSERDKNSPLYRATRRLRFSSALTRRRTFRVALPVIFVVIVMFPLSSALLRVKWEVEAKKRVNQVLERFEQAHQVLSKRQAVTFKSVAVRLTVVGEPDMSKAMEKELGSKLAKAAGVEPDIRVEVVPSTAFMDERLKTSTDRLNRELAVMRMDRGPALEAQIEGFSDSAARKIPVSMLADYIRVAFSGEIDFLAGSDAEGQWVSWTISIPPHGAILGITRIADSDLPESTMALMSGVLREKTGLAVSISEQRLAKTVYRSAGSVVGRTSGALLEKRLTAAQKLENVGVRICLPPETPRTANANRQLSGLVRKIIPESRLLLETCAGIRRIELFKMPEKSSPSPDGAEAAPARADASAATPSTP